MKETHCCSRQMGVVVTTAAQDKAIQQDKQGRRNTALSEARKWPTVKRFLKATIPYPSSASATSKPCSKQSSAPRRTLPLLQHRATVEVWLSFLSFLLLFHLLCHLFLLSKLSYTFQVPFKRHGVQGHLILFEKERYQWNFKHFNYAKEIPSMHTSSCNYSADTKEGMARL